MLLLKQLSNVYGLLFSKVGLLLTPVVLLGLRIQIANVFLSSGLTKWNGFLVFNPDKYDLFLYEFFCPMPLREGALRLCDAQTSEYVAGSAMVTFIESLAVMAGIVEVVLPILLIVGLLSRFATLGLLAMTLFIQLAVFPEWDHWLNPASWWFAVLMVLLVSGPGSWSLDRWLGLEKKA